MTGSYHHNNSCSSLDSLNKIFITILHWPSLQLLVGHPKHCPHNEIRVIFHIIIYTIKTVQIPSILTNFLTSNAK